MNKEHLLSYKYLISILDYDPIRGRFYKVSDGKQIGYLNSDGYRIVEIKIANKRYKFSEHRLAWFYVNGTWPADLIDHVDLDKAHNRYINLRPSNYTQNAYNQKIRVNNKAGVKGVSFDKTANKFRVRVRKDGKTFSLGNYNTLKEATIVAEHAINTLHGKFARTM